MNKYLNKMIQQQMYILFNQEYSDHKENKHLEEVNGAFLIKTWKMLLECMQEN